MASLNHCTFIGNLGRDPEVRYTAAGRAVANFNIACTEKWTDRDSGETQERTEWVRVQVWGKQAENVGQFLKKGSPAYVAGQMRTRKYTDREGTERTVTEIVANQVVFLGSGGAGYKPKDGDAPPRDTGVSGPSDSPPPDFDDDIPF